MLINCWIANSKYRQVWIADSADTDPFFSKVNLRVMIPTLPNTALLEFYRITASLHFIFGTAPTSATNQLLPWLSSTIAPALDKSDCLCHCRTLSWECRICLVNSHFRAKLYSKRSQHSAASAERDTTSWTTFRGQVTPGSLRDSLFPGT